MAAIPVRFDFHCNKGQETLFFAHDVARSTQSSVATVLGLPTALCQPITLARSQFRERSPAVKNDYFSGLIQHFASSSPPLPPNIFRPFSTDDSSVANDGIGPGDEDEDNGPKASGANHAAPLLHHPSKVTAEPNLASSTTVSS